MRTHFASEFLSGERYHIYVNGLIMPRARRIMELKLGRKLLSSELAHHINEVKTDDHPDNLELKTKSTHAHHHFKGKSKSDTHKRKIAEAQRGRKRKPLTDEQKENISKFHKGRKHSKEHRQKNSESVKRYWARFHKERGIIPKGVL